MLGGWKEVLGGRGIEGDGGKRKKIMFHEPAT